MACCYQAYKADTAAYSKLSQLSRQLLKKEKYRFISRSVVMVCSLWEFENFEEIGCKQAIVMGLVVNGIWAV